MKNISTLIFSAFAFFSSEAQQSLLDSTFHFDGIVTTEIDSGSGIGAIALQADGKIVAVGSASENLFYPNFAIARYNIDGSIDYSFSGDGKIVTSVGPGDASDYASSVAFQTNGKLVVAGTRHYYHDDMVLIRYNIDGSMDSSFGADGIVITDFVSDNDKAHAVAIQPDDKILVAGQSDNGSYGDFAVVRYNYDGSLDGSFGVNGKLSTSISPENDGAHDLLIQQDGKIVLGGYTDDQDWKFALIRYEANGKVDSSFGENGNGIVVTDSSGGINSLAWQPDGKIVAAGSSGYYPDYDFALARYQSDGSIDSSFSENGIVTASIGIYSDIAESVSIQPDGKIVVAGTVKDGGYYHFTLVRYHSDGSLDESFGQSGILKTDFGSSSYAHALAIQADGKIIEAGSSNNSFTLVRYTATLELSSPDFTSVHSSVEIYPNPANDKVIVKFSLKDITDEYAVITTYDLFGKSIWNEKVGLINGSFNKQFNHVMQDGIYLLQVCAPSGCVSEQLVIQH